MSGYNTVLRIRRLEKELDSLGFMMCNPKHGGWSGLEHDDRVAIKPRDDESLPIYARDAELFIGTIRDLEIWIRGVEWARGYDMLLRLSDDKKRARKEQDLRNENMMRRIKSEKVLQKNN